MCVCVCVHMALRRVSDGSFIHTALVTHLSARVQMMEHGARTPGGKHHMEPWSALCRPVVHVQVHFIYLGGTFKKKKIGVF